MVKPVDTTIPPERRHHPPEWHAMWVHACIEMAPYGRRPSVHLIDQLLDMPDRNWLLDQFAGLGDATIQPGGTLQSNGRETWNIQLLDHATMIIKDVRVVLDIDGVVILTAHPM